MSGNDSELNKAWSYNQESAKYSAGIENQTIAGVLRLYGWGTTKNEKLGVQQLMTAAEKGSTPAQVVLGRWYLERNMNTYHAVQMLVRASLKTNEVAMAEYAKLLHEGKFVVRDDERSQYWKEMVQKSKERQEVLKKTQELEERKQIERANSKTERSHQLERNTSGPSSPVEKKMIANPTYTEEARIVKRASGWYLQVVDEVVEK